MFKNFIFSSDLILCKIIIYFQSTSGMVVMSSSVPEIREKILEVLHPLGFEIRPFLIGWYNGQERQEPWAIGLKINCFTLNGLLPIIRYLVPGFSVFFLCFLYSVEI